MPPGMCWKTIRLELGCTAGFPKGSASRAYLLQVPFDASGSIDRNIMRRHPALATVRRFWPSEPDAYGRIESSDGSWVFCYPHESGDTAFHFGPNPLRMHEQVMVREPNGTELPFRIASIRSPGSSVGGA
jgi:hypothetical protein